jgi:hypothetical protein
VEAIEVKKGEMETQWKFDEEVLHEERRKVQATKLTMDAMQDEADAQNLVLPKFSNIYSKTGTIQCCEARPAEVDDVCTRMNEEVAILKSVLKSVKGKMNEKEREVHRVMEGRGDTEKLMEEIWYVMIIQIPSPSFFFSSHSIHVSRTNFSCTHHAHALNQQHESASFVNHSRTNGPYPPRSVRSTRDASRATSMRETRSSEIWKRRRERSQASRERWTQASSRSRR